VAQFIGVSPESISLTFYIFVAVFGTTACVGGPWLQRYGPRRMSFLGSILFFMGHLGAGLSLWLKNVYLLYVTFGLFGGAGIGLAYLCPIAGMLTTP
jgi:energy-converting hydrogenase Eha subunit A